MFKVWKTHLLHQKPFCKVQNIDARTATPILIKHSLLRGTCEHVTNAWSMYIQRSIGAENAAMNFLHSTNVRRAYSKKNFDALNVVGLTAEMMNGTPLVDYPKPPLPTCQCRNTASNPPPPVQLIISCALFKKLSWHLHLASISSMTQVTLLWVHDSPKDCVSQKVPC